MINAHPTEVDMTRGPRRAITTGWTGLIALVALSASAGWLLGVRMLAVAPRSGEQITAARVDDWVELGVLAGGLALALWMLAGSLAGIACATLARRRGAPAAVDALGAWTPAVVRRLVRGAAGLGVGAGLVLAPVAATADDAPVAVVELGWQSTAASPDVVEAAHQSQAPAPDEASAHVTTTDPADTEPVHATTAEVAPTGEPTDAATPADDVVPAADGQDAERPLDAQRTTRLVEDEEAAVREVVVVRGDTLWDIAARSLPADASDADVLRETVRWHQANADVIGDDPDLVLPGQVLRSP
jgi:nucleoid-associated protein YgaU